MNTKLMAKLTLIKEETCRCEEAEKEKTNMTMELAAFRVSQPFFDECGVFYGDEFVDCLKQVEVIYPDLDLSQIAIDDIISPTPGENDTVSDEIDISIHTVEQEVKDLDVEVVIQPALKGSVVYYGWLDNSG